MNPLIPVKAGPQSLSINAAITACRYSQLAYGLEPLPVDCEMIDMNPARDVQCMVVKEPGKLTFAFRGTTDMRGWLIDASVKFKCLGGKAKAHTGFWTDVDVIWHELMKFIDASPGLPIYTTGHSKGAAECRQFTYRLAADAGLLATESITFGEPRSFNWDGARCYNNFNVPTYRIMDEADIVCRIPWRFGLYRHVGRSVFFDAWGNIAFDEPWYAHLPSDATEIVKEAFRRKNALVYDHGIQLYLDRLKSYKLQLGV